MAKKSKATRTFRSAQQWQELINLQARSPSTISDFCAQHGVSVSGFYLWRRKLAAGMLVADDQPHGASPASFIEIDMPAFATEASQATTSAQDSWAVELQIGAHIMLRVRP